MTVSGVSSSSQSSNKVYDKMDTNKDGKVSAEEELAYKLKHPEKPVEKHAEKQPDKEKKTQSNGQISDYSQSTLGTIVDTTA